MRRSLLPTLCLVLLLVTCRQAPPSPEETTLTAVGQPAPTFQLTTLDGEDFDLADQQGRVVLLSFFATWCGPCKEELPYLQQEVWPRFQEQQFTMLAIAREQTIDEVQPFVESLGLTFPVATDPERAAYKLYASQYIPRTVVIGPDGTILHQASGFTPAEMAHTVEIIEQALQPLGTPPPDTSPAAAE